MARVKDEMVADPIAATVPGTRGDLLALFQEHGHAGFPVVKEGARKLVGVVTRQDLFEHPDESQVALLMDPNPPTTYPEASIREAARILVDHDLRVLPVVSGTNDLAGLVSAVELLRPLTVPNGHLASHLTRHFTPIHVATPAGVAMEMLRATRATALPMLDDEGLYAGLVTDGDLLANARIVEGSVRTTAGLAGDGDDWKWEGLRDARRVRHATTRLALPKAPVSELRRRDVEPLGPNAPLSEATGRILSGQAHHVPVVSENRRLRGLLGENDLLRACLPAGPLALAKRP